MRLGGGYPRRGWLVTGRGAPRAGLTPTLSTVLTGGRKVLSVRGGGSRGVEENKNSTMRLKSPVE